MKNYHYHYIDTGGHRRVGSTTAESIDDAQHMLHMNNTIVIDIIEATGNKQVASTGNTKQRGKVKKRELIEFCIYLGTLTQAGLPLTASLKEFTLELQNDYFTHIVMHLIKSVENGETLSNSMQAFPRVFSHEFIHLIAAGERTGTLPSSFKELRSYLEWQERLKGDITQATTYPLFITCTLAVFILFLFASVIPKMTAILIEMNIPLPLITQLIVGVSNAIVHTWHIYILAGIAIPVLVKLLLRRNWKIALLYDTYKLRIPVFGNLIRLIVQARFTKNFSVLHHAGISVLENLELNLGFIGNRLYARALKSVIQKIEEGQNLSESLKNTGLFSGLVIKMFTVGESTGNLEESLLHAASYYDEEIPRKIKQVFSLLEPLIIIMLIGTIGLVAIAVFLPILSISQGLNG